MRYAIFRDGNLVVSFRDERAAVDALRRLRRQAPQAAAGRLLLVAFDDSGQPVRDWLPPAADANGPADADS